MEMLFSNFPRRIKQSLWLEDNDDHIGWTSRKINQKDLCTPIKRAND